MLLQNWLRVWKFSLAATWVLWQIKASKLGSSLLWLFLLNYSKLEQIVQDLDWSCFENLQWSCNDHLQIRSNGLVFRIVLIHHKPGNEEHTKSEGRTTLILIDFFFLHVFLSQSPRFYNSSYFYLYFNFKDCLQNYKFISDIISGYGHPPAQQYKLVKCSSLKKQPTCLLWTQNSGKQSLHNFPTTLWYHYANLNSWPVTGI